MKVFLSYSHRDLQICALRIKAVAECYGYEVRVPPAWTREGTHPTASYPDIGPLLRDCDLLLTIDTQELHPEAHWEFQQAEARSIPQARVTTRKPQGMTGVAAIEILHSVWLCHSGKAAQREIAPLALLAAGCLLLHEVEASEALSGVSQKGPQK